MSSFAATIDESASVVTIVVSVGSWFLLLFAHRLLHKLVRLVRKKHILQQKPSLLCDDDGMKLWEKYNRSQRRGRGWFSAWSLSPGMATDGVDTLTLVQSGFRSRVGDITVLLAFPPHSRQCRERNSCVIPNLNPSPGKRLLATRRMLRLMTQA